jgi:hypothetical protein
MRGLFLPGARDKANAAVSEVRQSEADTSRVAWVAAKQACRSNGMAGEPPSRAGLVLDRTALRARRALNLNLGALLSSRGSPNQVRVSIRIDLANG